MLEAGSISYIHQVLGDLPGHQDWLHPEERKFLDTLRFEKRRNDWLLGRWTAKQALLSFFESRGFSIALHAIAILKGANGAPEVRLEEGLPQCSLSISHRAGHAIAVVGPPDAEIGCDLELIEPRSEAFLSDYFLDSEQAFLSGVPPGEKDLYANLLWCVKESVMKATGEGMRLHPREIGVEVLDLVISKKEWNLTTAKVGSLPLRFLGKWRREGAFVIVAIVKNPIL